jgi:hypothetical protein
MPYHKLVYIEDHHFGAQAVLCDVYPIGDLIRPDSVHYCGVFFHLLGDHSDVTRLGDIKFVF